MSKDKDADVPSVRELEALEQKDRKETAEILSGFDRPGRTPRAPRVQRDFVEHFSSPSAKAVAPPSSRSRHRAETEPREKATVLVPRREDMRTKLTWAVAVLGMILFGVTIAVLATPPAPNPPSVSSVAPPQGTMPTVAPSSATTITSAEPRADTETTNDAVSDAVSDTVIVAPPPSAAKKATPSPAKSVPRDDFIRDM